YARSRTRLRRWQGDAGARLCQHPKQARPGIGRRVQATRRLCMTRPVASRRAAVVFGAMALAGAMLAGLAPAAMAVPPACRVKNPTQDTWFAPETGQAL